MAGYPPGGIIGALLAGILCGAVPLILGYRRMKAGLGWAGLAACVLGGLLLGLFLAVPASGLFAWLILKHDKKTQGLPSSSETSRPETFQPPEYIRRPVGERKCPNCGHGNPTDANFCEECGQKLGVLFG